MVSENVEKGASLLRAEMCRFSGHGGEGEGARPNNST